MIIFNNINNLQAYPLNYHLTPCLVLSSLARTCKKLLVEEDLEMMLRHFGLFEIVIELEVKNVSVWH